MASLFVRTKLIYLTQTLTHFSTLPPFTSFKAAKSAVDKSSDPEQLLTNFQRSSQLAQFKRHRPVYTRTIRKLAKWGRTDLVEKILESQKGNRQGVDLSEGFWIRIIMLYSRAGMVDEAMNTFDLMGELNCVRTIKSICAVLSVHLDNGRYDKVQELFNELPKKIGVSHGIVSCNLVLKAICRGKKDMESARTLVENMSRKHNVKPNIDTYNILLGAYLKKEHDPGFDSVVEEIAKSELAYSVTTYNHIISRLCKNKECVRANKLFDEMVSKGITPNLTAYNTIIVGFCELSDVGSARKVFDRLLSDGLVSPMCFTYYTLVRHTVKDGEFELGLDMCKEILKRKGVPPFDVVKDLVSGLVKLSKSKDASELVEKIKKRLKGTSAESWKKVEATLPL